MRNDATTHAQLSESLTHNSVRTRVPTHTRKGREGKGREVEGIFTYGDSTVNRYLATRRPGRRLTVGGKP